MPARAAAAPVAGLEDFVRIDRQRPRVYGGDVLPSPPGWMAALAIAMLATGCTPDSVAPPPSSAAESRPSGVASSELWYRFRALATNKGR